MDENMEFQNFADSMFKDTPEESGRIFRLLVMLADFYVCQLEHIADDDPAPFLGQTPLDAAMLGLRENLDMIRRN